MDFQIKMEPQLHVLCMCTLLVLTMGLNLGEMKRHGFGIEIAVGRQEVVGGSWMAPRLAAAISLGNLIVEEHN